MQHDHVSLDTDPASFWRSRYAIGLIFFGVIALYFLLTEHRAHLFFALPFLFLLACPLMHVFMHHGHGGHAGKHISPDVDDRRVGTSPGSATGGDRP